MRKSKLETAETRKRIVATASREFQREGIHATGLAELMVAAGLTRGGFYRHFASKDHLVAEACAESLDKVIHDVEAAASNPSEASDFRALVDYYLEQDVRGGASDGCPFAALGSELARADLNTRTVATDGFLKMVDLVAAHIRRRKSETSRSEAMFALNSVIGAVMMSRIITDPELSARILREASDHLVRLIGKPPSQPAGRQAD